MDDWEKVEESGYENFKVLSQNFLEVPKKTTKIASQNNRPTNRESVKRLVCMYVCMYVRTYVCVCV
jgi:hypothetical protein